MRIETRSSEFETQTLGQVVAQSVSVTASADLNDWSGAGGWRQTAKHNRFSIFGSRVSSFEACGFTLLELSMVMALILILASLAVPTFHVAIVRAREAVLKEDLYTMRKLIDQYTLDKQHPPQSLDDLVESGYLRGGIPVDPFTGTNDTWRADMEDVPSGPDQTTPGIVDVHSGSEDASLDGTAYSSW